jgi:hypothetical protein
LRPAEIVKGKSMLPPAPMKKLKAGSWKLEAGSWKLLF